MKDIDFDSAYSELTERLSGRNEIVLATSDKNRVTARTIWYVSDGLDLYFITSRAYTKYKQISKNPLIALCFGNVQLEAVAHDMGHPSEPDNMIILRSCKQINDPFLFAAKYKSSVLIKAEVTNVEQWKNDGREYLDIQKRKGWRIG